MGNQHHASATLLPRTTGRPRLKCDGTRAETRFGLSAKRTSPFKSAGASVQSNAGSRGVRISGSNAGYATLRGSVRVLATHSIRQFPLHFPSHASPRAIRYQLGSINCTEVWVGLETSLNGHGKSRPNMILSPKRTGRDELLHRILYPMKY
jgi:hypothetical protein